MPLGLTKKCHCSQTVIIAQVVVGEFYCSSYSSALAYCHVLYIFMTDVDPVEFIQIWQYFTESVFTRGRTFLIYGQVSFFYMGEFDAPKCLWLKKCGTDKPAMSSSFKK